MRLCVCVNNDNKNINPIETIDSIYNSGFRDVFIQWYDKELDISQEEQLKYIRKLGLNVTFAHLGYKGLNEIWNDSEEGEALVKKYLRNIDECSLNNIPMVVMHLVGGSEYINMTSIGLERFKTICEYAKEKGIKVAFENTKLKGYLEFILSNITYSNVGVCFDSGHYHCHFKDEFDFHKFKDRILCVHIHDNFGESDEHLIPFDGNLEYNKVIEGLKIANYSGDMILELCYRNNYLNISPLEFYKKGYEIGNKLVSMYEGND